MARPKKATTGKIQQAPEKKIGKLQGKLPDKKLNKRVTKALEPDPWTGKTKRK